MTPLFCQECDREHDLDVAPDTGVCEWCGGQLVEFEGERVGKPGEGIVDAVNNGLAATAINRGKAPRGAN